MSSKIFRTLLFLSGIVISIITNLYTSEANVQSWYSSNRNLTLFIGIGCVVFGAAFTIAADSSEANAEGKSYSYGGLLGGVLLDAIGWSLFGAIIGLAVELAILLFLLIGVTDPGVKNIIDRIDSLRVAGVITGLFVGTRLRFLSEKPSIDPAVLGMVAGVFSAMLLPTRLYEIFAVPKQLVSMISDTVLFSASLAAVWASSTALFKVGFDQRKNIRESKIRRIIGTLKSKGLTVETNAIGSAIEYNVAKEFGVDRTRRQIQMDWQTHLWLKIFWIIDSASALAPPFVVFDSNGNSLGVFNSTEELDDFSQKFK